MQFEVGSLFSLRDDTEHKCSFPEFTPFLDYFIHPEQLAAGFSVVLESKEVILSTGLITVRWPPS